MHIETITSYPEISSQMPLEGLGEVEYYPNGALRGVVLIKPNRVLLPMGEYTPNYHYDSPRSKHSSSISFFPSGNLKSIRFDKPEEISLPNGMTIPLEKLTFYESGKIKKAFPLDGGISGFWSESDERSLARRLNIDLSIGSFSLLITALSFYETGDMRSVTLWPEERLELRVGANNYQCRIGFSLDPYGRVNSLEPAVPTKVSTPIGILEAYDPEAIGVSADSNSLKFDGEGNVTGLKSLVVIKYGANNPTIVEPLSKPHPLDDFKIHYQPLTLSFEGEQLKVSRTPNVENEEYLLKLDDSISVGPFIKHKFARLVLPNNPGTLSLGL